MSEPSWTRVEGLGVSADLTAGLSARIADPLWMLARQWQVGELTGEDAASPLLFAAAVAHAPLTELRVGKAAVEPVDPVGGALEAQAECEDVLTGSSRPRIALELAAHFGRTAAVAKADPGLLARLRSRYPVALPAPSGSSAAPVDVHDVRGTLELELLARTGFDALALAEDLRAGRPVDAALGDPADPDSPAAGLLAAVDTFQVPGARPPAWDDERLGYDFSVATAGGGGGTGTVLGVHDYAGGHLDWSAFDVAQAAERPLGADAAVERVVSVALPLQFAGMPANRFWELEDTTVTWGWADGGPFDLPRYLVGSFALLYADDWFTLGVGVPRGSLAQVQQVVVTDSFGRTRPVPSTAAADHERTGDDRPWRFWELTGDPSAARGQAPLLLVPAALPPHERSRPVEEVSFLRDEVANLAWAIERVVEAPSGRRVVRSGGPRRDTSARAATDDAATWNYDLATEVPANAVPLVPVRLSETDPAIRFQRGRLATGGESTRGAVGAVLVPDRRLLLREEEVPAGGVQVTRAWESCRTPDGGLLVWMGRRTRPGRGPKAPGLRHDVVTPTTAPPAATEPSS